MASNYFAHPLLCAHDWQHRPEFDAVCQWWRGGGRGMLVLVGMGGAGKTAIVERFLRVLPGGLPTDPDVPKDGSLLTPHNVFVFSFYDAPNPEVFFEDLQMWLENSPRVQTVLSLGQMFYLLQQTPGLLVLDGLEKVQEDGVRGLLGRLASPKLREFLDRIAAGYLPDLSVLVTSRFPLADLRDARSQFFHLLPIEDIELPVGSKLLRARGVRGTDLQLEGIVEACGRHALTVDFAGGYIAEFGGGNPAMPVDFEMDSARLRQRLDDEPDEARRHVLKQGNRFARLAERYRDAMLGNTADGGEGDSAALALLQRICLFRLGVEAETLVNIFTGKKAAKVSGSALASLSRPQLQRKLDWLVRMRIVECTVRSSTLNSQPPTLYSIHPAVRDGFLSGIGDDALRENHEAVRQGLQVSLGEAPGRYPSDPATLDLLEEIVHHTLQCGHVSEAWDIYEKRIGKYEILGWRLGQYERGNRICQAIARIGGATSPKVIEMIEVSLLEEWGRYLIALGQLGQGISVIKQAIAVSQERRKSPEFLYEYLSQACSNVGRLSEAKFAAERSFQCAQGRADQLSATTFLPSDCYKVDEIRQQSYGISAQISALCGDIQSALSGFSAVAGWGHRSGHPDDMVLFNWLLIRLGRFGKAKQSAESDRAFVQSCIGDENEYLTKFDLLLAEVSFKNQDLNDPDELVDSAREWALHYHANGIMCWVALIRAKIKILARNGQQSMGVGQQKSRECTETILEEGLRNARDCGLGLYHIDLLLVRARLHLRGGEPQAALDDLSTALYDGVPADEQTGQPELLAATHVECGYAWAIAEGLQLRAEALLLKAAQMLGQSTFAPAHRAALPAAVRDLLTQAESCLTQALACWHPLRDPKPERADQNFQLDGKEYNYRADESHNVLTDLIGGVLTNYPLHSLSQPTLTTPKQESDPKMSFHVFLSHNSKDKPAVRELKKRLLEYSLAAWFDEDELQPGIPWQQLLENGITESQSSAVLVGKDGLGPWEDEEMQVALRLAVTNKNPVIPVLMPGASSQPKLPMFLGNRTWVDLRDGFTKEGLDKLVWGITGKKPIP